MSQTDSPKVEALKQALDDRDPFCKGVCTVPEHQLLLYFAQGTGFSRIDFAHASTEELEAFFKACQPASFALDNKDVFDETYRKAGKMDLSAFSTLFDPRSLGIHSVIERDLLATNQTVELELYKLNVYGKEGFFKAHRDTPREDSMFGTLVVVLPAPHVGGQLSLRVDDHHWIVDFTEQFSAATTPSVCFVAFFGDVEHQVLPVVSGHRVTLTYNLYFRAQNNMPRTLSGPFYERLKTTLMELVNDAETLPDGGYLGVGLYHQYSYDEAKPIDSLLENLKGSDAALAGVCGELGLPCSLKLLYVQQWDAFPNFVLLSRSKLETSDRSWSRATASYDDENLDCLLQSYVGRLTLEDLEGVDIIGRDSEDDQTNKMGKGQAYSFMKKFYKEPVTQVMEVKKMSSVLCETAYGCYGNEVSTQRFYGAACMMISVKPKESREHLAL